MAKTTCSVIEDGELCGKPSVGQDLCRKHYMRKRRNGDPLIVRPRGAPQVLGPERACTKCAEIKPTEDFLWLRTASGKQYRGSWCSDCRAQYHREYEQANAERIRVRRREYAQVNKDHRRETNRAYRAANRDRANGWAKAWRERNPEQHRQVIRNWHEANPEKVREYALRHWYRKRANWVEDVDRAVLFARDRGLCGVCGLPVDPLRWQLDHIRPVSRGGEHSYANAQVSHPLCNTIKNDRLTELPSETVEALRAAHRAAPACDARVLNSGSDSRAA